MRRSILVVLVLTALPLAFSCGGGGGSGGFTGGPPLSAFAGTWWGPGDDGIYEPFAVRVVMDGSGDLSSYDIDYGGGFGSVGFTPAAFVKEDESSARITFVFDTEGGLFWDDAVEHLLFVDSSNMTYSVMEKDAAGLPAYQVSDAAGSWIGYAYAYDNGTGDFEKESPVTLTVENSLAFSGTDAQSGSFTGFFNGSLFSASHGMYVGTVAGAVDDQSIQIFLSPDLSFSGGVIWGPAAAWPDDYVFVVLTKR
ncbi:MAG: hypothetical protein PVJ01_02930 [Pseudomonadota bacterium]|jgi:hypothetical protein